MTERINIHNESPTENKLHHLIVYNRRHFVLSRQEEGVTDVWMWRNDEGELCAAW